MNWKTFLGSWAGLTVLVFFLYDALWALADFAAFVQMVHEDAPSLAVDFAYCATFVLFSISISAAAVRYNLPRHLRRGRMVALATVLLVANMLWAGVIENLLDHLFFEQPDYDWGNAFFMGILAYLVSLLYTMTHYYRQAVRQQEEMQRMQMQLLKMQLNPHFVFNSLSVLASLIEEDPARAERYTIRMSRIYRHILRHLDADTVPLREAIAFARDYMALLRLRFQCIDMDFREFAYTEDECILSLSLQVLIENAVKHNPPVPPQRLTLTIDRQGDCLRVSNNCIRSAEPSETTLPSHGVGLTNLAKRYLVRFGREISYEETSEAFTVLLPIIKHDNHAKESSNH